MGSSGFVRCFNLLAQTRPREIRWGNKTDFYSLFTAVAALLATKKVAARKSRSLGSSLRDFAADVDNRLGDENAKVSKAAASYVRNVQRGANDKARRAERHAVLLAVLEPFFA